MHQAVAAWLIPRAMMAAVASLVLLGPVLAPLPLHAQSPAAIGTLEGRDASVEHPATAAVNTAGGTPVGNGSVVVVHSGKARMRLTGGDAISICGPAKFTVLQSGDAVTLALEFGSLHISLRNTPTPLEAYTPFFTAFPQSTEGSHREFAIGLDANGIFCARAIHGGVKLEQQLTGHSLVVPQPSETFLRGGDITPLRDPPGHCECAVTLADITPIAAPPVETTNAAPTTEHAATALANPAAPARPAGEAAPPATSPDSAVTPPVSASPLPPSAAPPTSPIRAASAAGSSAIPATASVATKVTMPPLAFDYSSPNTPPNANPDAAVLLDDSRVTPGWVFSGHVGKGSSPAASASSAHATGPATTHASPAQQHEGFWSKLKHVFGGGKNTGSQQ